MKGAPARTLPPLRNAIWDYIALVGAIFTILDVLFRFLTSFSHFHDFRDFLLLLVLTLLILLELRELSEKPAVHDWNGAGRLQHSLFVPLRYSVPLVMLSLGVSVSFRSASEIANRVLGGIV